MFFFINIFYTPHGFFNKCCCRWFYDLLSEQLMLLPQQWGHRYNLEYSWNNFSVHVSQCQAILIFSQLFINGTNIVNLYYLNDVITFLVLFISIIITPNIGIYPNKNLINFDWKCIFWRCLIVILSKLTISSSISSYLLLVFVSEPTNRYYSVEEPKKIHPNYLAGFPCKVVIFSSLDSSLSPDYFFNGNFHRIGYFWEFFLHYHFFYMAWQRSYWNQYGLKNVNPS